MSSRDCVLCNTTFSTVSNLNKHLKRKHADLLPQKVNRIQKNGYTCNNCNQIFNLKKNIIKHHKHEHSGELKLKCSFENCESSYKTLKYFTKHLESDHNINIKTESLSFNTVEEFKKWKTNIEDTNICQYIQRTSTKTHNNVEYTYYSCHRSYTPRLVSKGLRNPKRSGSVKIGKVCPSYIKVHKNETQVQIEFCSTHLFHENEIRKQRIPIEEKNKIAGKLAIGVPVNHILNGIRRSVVGTEIKRIHLIKKKDIHNIIRDYNISYNTKTHENDAVSVRLWVEDMQKKGETLIEETNEPNLPINIPVTSSVSNNQLVIDNGLIKIGNIDNFNSEIKNKVELILGMCNRTNLNDEDQINVLRYCDKVLNIFAKNKDIS